MNGIAQYNTAEFKESLLQGLDPTLKVVMEALDPNLSVREIKD